MDRKIEDLITKIKHYNSNADFALIRKAYLFAEKAHLGQKRRSGEDFINHPLAVANYLADWRLDSRSIVAGLLHDTVEDAEVTLLQIEGQFGETVAKLVDGVTKIGEIKLRGRREEAFVENLRKMLVVMAQDLRVIVVKLADRYHNMQTLYVLPIEKQKQIAGETIGIYAPLAERLGIGEMKGNLEDLAFPYLLPAEYHWVKNYSKAYFKEADTCIKKVKQQLLRVFSEEEIKAQVDGRQKHLYSLYLKLNRPEINKDIRKIYDLMALRVIVDTVEDCYRVLGLVHKHYKPIPAVGIRDFIAQPKPNGYQSIHTTVFGYHGKITEMQIRTQIMHEEAENGIAAHWYFSQEKATSKDSQVEAGFFAPTEKLLWVKELMKWQKEITDSKEFIDSLKFDALTHRNFIFSPNGDVFDLPAGATPVDFAYAVHTNLGDICGGAKVDGKLVPLDYRLKSGQIVEIIPKKVRSGPSRDWLNFVITRTAKRQIEKHFNKR